MADRGDAGWLSARATTPRPEASATTGAVGGRGGAGRGGVETVLPGRLLEEMMRELELVTPGMGGRGPGTDGSG